MKNNKSEKNSNKKNQFSKKDYQRRSPLSNQPLATDDKFRPVFAGYFNMARANLYSVLRYISVQCGLDVNQKEDSMHELPIAKFADNRRPEVRQKAFYLLMRHIPVLQQMSQSKLTQGKPAKENKSAVEKHLAVSQKDVQQVLQDIIRVVNFQRNFYTHANHYDTQEEIAMEIKREKNLYRPLEITFKGSKREVKRVFRYTAKEMFFVDQEERMKKIKMKDSSGKVLKDDKGNDRCIFVEHADWFFRLYDTTEDSMTNMPIPQKMTTAGFVFLLCKLLHKQYATQLTQQIGIFRTCKQSGFSPFTEIENNVMFNIFCARRIRLPKGRMESVASDSALGLDMLSELQKCPAELFDTLSTEDRKLFQIKRKDGEVIQNPDDDINLFRRHGDRFPLLALKYIDTMRDANAEKDKVMKDIVFQVALGKFRHTFYNRASLDTKEKDRLRVLQKEINGFGPIEKVENQRKTKYESLIRPISDDPKHLYDADTAETEPYLTDHHASYAITGNRIGLTWNALVQKPGSEEKRNSIRLKWKDGMTEKLDNDNCFLPALPTPTENIAPRAWLSIYDLPGLIFLHILGGDPEKVIKDTYERLSRLFNDICDGKLLPLHEKSKEEAECQLEVLLSSDPYHLKPREVPQKIKDYLLKCGPQNEEMADVEFNKWVNRQLDGYSKNDYMYYLLIDVKKGTLTPMQKSHDSTDRLKKKLLKDYQLGLNDIPQKLKRYLSGEMYLNDRDEKNKFESWLKRQLRYVEERKFTSIILRLNKRMKQFEDNLKQVGDKQNRIGTKGYVDIRPGSLARYIVKDIMAMTAPDRNLKNGGKPSGLDYGVLQSSIATFCSSDKPFEETLLGNMLAKAINVNNHPFLRVIMKQHISNTIDLYRKYQKAKLDYLRDLRRKGNYKEQWFLREAYRNHVAKTPEYMQGVKGLAARYLETLQLPDGLFTDAICEQLAVCEMTRNNEMVKADLSDKDKKSGVSHLINTYFVHVLGDNSQPFYNELKRHYKVLDWAYFKQNTQNPTTILTTMVPPELYFTDEEITSKLRKGKLKDAPIADKIEEIAKKLQTKIGTKTIHTSNGLKTVPDYGAEGSANDTEKDTFRGKLTHMRRELQRNERDIRRYRNQDMLLFLMAKRLLLSGGVVFRNEANIQNGIDRFQLQDILPPAMKKDGDKSILEQKVDFKLSINLKDECGKPIIGEDGKVLQRTIMQNGIKLKNYGDFYSFLYDSRVGSLLSQIRVKGDIKRENLENEFDHYDRQRREVFRLLQAIEWEIIKANPAISDENAGKEGFYYYEDGKRKPYRNSFRNLLSLCKKYVNEQGNLNDLSNLLNEIRNAFSHNRYARNNKAPLDISKLSLPQVADCIKKWIEEQKKQMKVR